MILDQNEQDFNFFVTHYYSLVPGAECAYEFFKCVYICMYRMTSP